MLAASTIGVGCLLLAACTGSIDEGPTSEQTGGATGDPTIDQTSGVVVDDEQAPTSEQTSRPTSDWNDGPGPDIYSFVYRYGNALCNGDRMRVDVVDGEVVDAEMLSDSCGLISLDDAVTIDDLLARIESHTDDDVLIDASYDDRMGYPTRVVVDQIAGAVDDEITFGVVSVTLTEQPRRQASHVDERDRQRPEAMASSTGSTSRMLRVMSVAVQVRRRCRCSRRCAAAATATEVRVNGPLVDPREFDDFSSGASVERSRQQIDRRCGHLRVHGGDRAECCRVGSVDQERCQRNRIVGRVPAALQSRGRARSSLADAHQLGAVECQLARPQAVEADQPGVLGRDHCGVVDRRSGETSGCERHGEPFTEPDHRVMDVVGPPRMPGGQQHVDPDHLTRNQQHRSAAAASANDFDPRPVASVDVHDPVVALCRPEHERWAGDFVDPDLRRCRFGDRECVELRCSRATTNDAPRRRGHCELTKRSADRRGGRVPGLAPVQVADDVVGIPCVLVVAVLGQQPEPEVLPRRQR